MTTSYIAHRSADGERLRAVLSLQVLKTLDHSKIEALKSMSVFSLSDLLHYAPVHRARIISAVAKGRLAHDMDLRSLVQDPNASGDPAQLAVASPEILDGIGTSTANLLKNRFGIQTIEQFAEFPPFVEAERLLGEAEDTFTEPASAPDDLIPTAMGAVSSTFRYSSFITDEDRTLHNHQLITVATPASPLWTFANAFAVTQLEGVPKIVLGYIILHRQRWITLGSQLGEVVHSVSLAPGESRNVSVIDWKSRHVTHRIDDTTGTEHLVADALHGRALDEVARAVANEHQWGRSTALAATAVAGLGAVGSGAAAGAMVGGVAGAASGAVSGGVTGAGLGALAGAIITSQSGGWGFLPGLFAGGAAGAAVGAIGFGAAGMAAGALIGGVASGVGFVMSESHGERGILATDRQNILDLTSQKASLVRSLRASIFIEDTQSQSSSVRTFNVTNYNHSHSLNLTYYEILQRYIVEMETERIEPFMLLPFQPIHFDSALVGDYWDILKTGIGNRSLVDAFDIVVGTDGKLNLPQQTVGSDASATIKTLKLDVRRDFASVQPDVYIRLRDGSERKLDGMQGELLNGQPIDHWKNPNGYNPKIADVEKIILKFGGLPRPSANYRVVVAELIIEAQNPQREAPIPAWSLDPLITVDGSLGAAPIDKEISWDIRSKLAGVESANANQHETIDAVVRYINRRKYFFTRLLISGMEIEQLTDILNTLRFKDGGVQVPLSAIAETMPIAITGRGLLLKLRTQTSVASGENPIDSYVDDLFEWFNGQKDSDRTSMTQVCLPSSGIFGEAILGRSNASEKIDLTRFWNWQDSPIPNAAPAIQAVPATIQPQEPLNTQPYMPANVLNVMPPTPLPDSTAMAGILAAIQNGNMFRDMSKTEHLTGLMTSLAATAEHAATAAGGMAGDAGAKTLQAAVDLGKTVADLAGKVLSAVPEIKPPKNVTHEGGRMNAEAEVAMKRETRPPLPQTPQQPSATNTPQPGLSTPRTYDRTLHPDLAARRQEAIRNVYGSRGLPQADTIREGNLEGFVTISKFGVNADALTDEQLGALSQLAMLLSSSSQAKLYIEGHASRTGPEETNVVLSEERAAVVRDWLLNQRGVEFGKVENALGIGSAFPPGSDREGSEDPMNRSVVLYYSIPQEAVEVTALNAPLAAPGDKQWRLWLAAGVTAGISPLFGGIGGTAAIVLMSDASVPIADNPTRYPFVFANAAFAKVLLAEESTVSIGGEADWFKVDFETKLSLFKMLWSALPYGALGFDDQEVMLRALATQPNAPLVRPLSDFNGTACNLITTRDGNLTDLAEISVKFPDLGLYADVGQKTLGGTGIGGLKSSGNLYPMPQWIRDLLPSSIESWLNLG